MTAGRGIVHSEMPEQENGLLMGFQLWVNLPRSVKMREPAYQEFPAGRIAIELWESGTRIRVIAGRTDQGTEGPVENDYVDPTYMDVELQAGDEFVQHLPEAHNAFIYVVDGAVKVGEHNSAVSQRTLAVLSEGERVRTSAVETSRFLPVAGRPLKEPVARGGRRSPCDEHQGRSAPGVRRFPEQPLLGRQDRHGFADQIRSTTGANRGLRAVTWTGSRTAPHLALDTF